MNSRKGLLLAVIALLAAPFAEAAESGAPESGFGGRLSLGGIFADARTNMVASPGLGLRVGGASIGSLTVEPKTHKGLLPLVDLRLRYTFASTGTELFLATGEGDALQFEGFAQGGVRQALGSSGTASLAYLYGDPAMVWADPYVVGARRKETTRASQGARVGWDGVFGSALHLQYTFRNTTIGNERSGALFNLSAADSRLLRRAGDTHQGEICYPITLGRAHQLAPTLSYTRDALAGEAMSAQAYDFKLRYAFHAGAFATQLEGALGRSVHDRRNPLFGRTQEDTRYGASATVLYRTPFGWAPLGYRRWSLFATVSYSAADSNITFYSANVLAAGVGLSTEF